MSRPERRVYDTFYYSRLNYTHMVAAADGYKCCVYKQICTTNSSCKLQAVPEIHTVIFNVKYILTHVGLSVKSK